MRRRQLAVFGLLAVMVGGVVVGVGSASGGSTATPPLRAWGFGHGRAARAPAVPHIERSRVMVLRGHDFAAAVIDNDPPGTSQGDEIAVEGRLTHAQTGNAAGRIEVHEVLTALTQTGGGRLQLVFTALLAHGQISGVAVLGLSQSGASNTKAAVIGGTGRYRNVRGEVFIHPAGQSTRLTFVLLP
jgi:hypothetical protein